MNNMNDNIVISEDLNTAIEYVPSIKLYKKWIRIYSSDIGHSDIKKIENFKRRKNANRSTKVSCVRG